MSKTILLGVATHRSRLIPRIGYTVFGLYFVFYGLYYFTMVAQNWLDMAFRITLLIIGVVYIVYANIVFDEKSRFAPRIKIDENEIYFKTSFFKKGSTILWSDVKSINFRPYRMNFKLKDRVENLAYDTHANVSIDIKEALRGTAEKHNIEVIGG